MKPGSSPTPPDDEAANDPLLTTLRQRLGDYGAAPPPAAWAAIRQRVVLPVRPWWRRPRRLLPLLALLLGVLLAGTLGQRRGWPASRPARSVARQPTGTSSLTGQPRLTKAAANHKQYTISPLPAAPAPQPDASHGATPFTVAGARQLASTHAAAPSLPERGKPAAPELPGARQGQLFKAAGSTPQPDAATYSRQSNSRQRIIRRGANAAPGASLRHSPPGLAYTRRPWASQRGYVAASTQPAAQEASAAQLFANAAKLVRGAAGAKQLRAGRRGAAAPSAPASGTARARPAKGSLLTSPIATEPLAFASPQALRINQASPMLLVPDQAGRAPAPGLLALKQPSLLLPPSALPAAPPARPDLALALPPVRRWAVLLAAGPTLSYRALGPAPVLAAGHPDFARLERPALGLGAQVQGRRVLSGRWALAAGLGYHEYATRLALTLKDTTNHAVRQRDTYRLLTVPVQLTYALGAPRGRLATGLLLGAEAGWYVGGRSTEGSGCGCEQQDYASAAASPYRPWSLALSLGLDLRYQLGGPASRWRWLVQPTVRYVATPFVRSDAVGFTPRQPFSMGVFTGFSWDVR